MSVPITAEGGVSIIVPTWNRSELLDVMLASLFRERSAFTGPSEVIVVDSSEDEERRNIEASCKRYDAILLDGEQNVRKKRNLGVDHARYALLLFIDSDVVVEPGLIQAHIRAYDRPGVVVGAAQGLTEFVGKGGFWWHVAELSGLTDSFSNARKYPFQSWSITNNLSVRRDVFERIGRFCETFPFRLGGDDLEMSYRIAHEGLMIASAPEAITLHTKETWDNPHALLDRTKRWGFMESRVCDLHPELYKFVIPKNYVFVLPLTALFAIAGALQATSGSPAVGLYGAAALIALWAIERYAIACRQNTGLVNPVHLLLAVFFNARYEAFRLAGHFSLGKRAPEVHGMVFNRYMALGSLKPDARRLKRLFITIAFVFMCMGVLARVL